MATLTEEQARAYMHKLLATMSQAGGSDLFIANDFPPSIKLNGRMQPLIAQKLNGEVTAQLAHATMNEGQRAEFAREMECNFAIAIPGLSRFRVNVFVQQQCVGMVLRRQELARQDAKRRELEDQELARLQQRKGPE